MIVKDENAPLFANSINRVIFVEKEEYILSYKHNKIFYSQNNSENLNLDIGKFYLTKQFPNKDGEIIQFVSSEKIIAKDTINQNVLKNDNFLIQKIVCILEGKLSDNETFKIDDGKVFKIVFHMKNGINLIMFNCELKRNVLKDYSEVMLTLHRYFKNKHKLNNLIDNEMNEKNKKNDGIAKKYSNLTREVEKEEKRYLENFCVLLNEKKKKIRSLQREIDGVGDLSLEKEESIKINHSSSFLKSSEDDPNQSQTYSLSDLI